MKYFLMFLSITLVTYAQQEPIENILHMVVRSIAMTLESLERNDIRGAALIASDADEKLGLLDYFDYLRFDGHIFDLIKPALKAEAVRCYNEEVTKWWLKEMHGYEGYIPYEYFSHLWAYHFIFTNNRCKKSWCDFQKDFLNNYERAQKKKHKYARDDYRLGYK